MVKSHYAQAAQWSQEDNQKKGIDEYKCFAMLEEN